MDELREELGLHGLRRSPIAKNRVSAKVPPIQAKANAAVSSRPKQEKTSRPGKAQPSVSPRVTTVSTKRLHTSPGAPSDRLNTPAGTKLAKELNDDRGGYVGESSSSDSSAASPVPKKKMITRGVVGKKVTMSSESSRTPGKLLAKELNDDRGGYASESSSSESSAASPVPKKKMITPGVVGKKVTMSSESSRTPGKLPDGRTAGAALKKRSAAEAEVVSGLAKIQKQTGSENFSETSDSEEEEVEMVDEVFTCFSEHTPSNAQLSRGPPGRTPAYSQDDTMALSGANSHSGGRRPASVEHSYDNSLDPSLMDYDSEEEKMALADAAARAHTKTPFRALTNRELHILSYLAGTELTARVSRSCRAPNELEHAMRSRFVRVFPLPSYDLACHSAGLPTRVWGEAENAWLIRMVDATRLTPRNQTGGKRPYIPWRHICELY
jgi:hypothetical protein